MTLTGCNATSIPISHTVNGNAGVRIGICELLTSEKTYQLDFGGIYQKYQMLVNDEF